jgi:hypothetical protein
MNISTKLLEDELTVFCESASLSQDGLREIIEKHGAANVPNINNYAFFLEACENEGISEGILRYLLEYFPNAARHADEEGRQLPLHYICHNKNVTLGMVQLLIDAFPDSVHHEGENGGMPIHSLCITKNSDGSVGLEILKLLLERCPESVRMPLEMTYFQFTLPQRYNRLSFAAYSLKPILDQSGMLMAIVFFHSMLLLHSTPSPR